MFRNTNFHDLIDSLIRTIELRDIYTAGHSKRVSEISELICSEMNIAGMEREYIHMAAHLHDIGKMGIADGILLKPERLTDPEYILLQQHPVIGSSVFDKFKELRQMSSIIKHHHERFDGLGYPSGLKGNEIPLGAQIISIADTFDAMTTTRPYRPSLEVEEAAKEIVRNKGKQFNPKLVDVFSKVFKKKKNIIKTITKNYHANDRRRLYKPFCSIKTNVQKNELVKNIRTK